MKLSKLVGIFGASHFVAISLNQPLLAFTCNAVKENHAEVLRAHQWVDTSTSLRGQQIHVKPRVVNETSGMFHGSFWPQLTLRFVDANGKNLAAYQLNLSCQANKKECRTQVSGPPVESQ